MLREEYHPVGTPFFVPLPGIEQGLTLVKDNERLRFQHLSPTVTGMVFVSKINQAINAQAVIGDFQENPLTFCMEIFFTVSFVPEMGIDFKIGYHMFSLPMIIVNQFCAMQRFPRAGFSGIKVYHGESSLFSVQTSGLFSFPIVINGFF